MAGFVSSGAGYLGAATPFKVRQIVSRLENDKTHVLMLHAGPDYFVGEGGGFSSSDLKALNEKTCYLALGHIHRPMRHGNWACNPGSLENCDVSEASYDWDSQGATVPRGYAVLEIDSAQRHKPIELRIHSNPRRPVHRLTLDCSPFGNKTKDGAAGLIKAALTLVRAAEVTPESVIDLRLTGRLNLNRIALDQASVASEIEIQARVLAVSIDLSGLDLGGLCAGEQAKGFSREELEKAAIREVVAAKHLWGMEHRADEFSAFCYELKEAVRQDKSGSELAEQIGRSPLLELIATSIFSGARKSGSPSDSGGLGMIVQSMRLKNIKSYGEGLDGEGVTIYFEPGANRIAGKNGHGKTTLIESLGYALFLTEPVFEESFQLETYFLRAGKKLGEIDVTFGHRGELYRIERGLGPNNKRKTKVVQLEDGSTCAEGEREVSAFLCRLFNLPDPKRFSELFWKLIGVRQGRLTWPFDSRPSAAKDFFEPLLDVAIFRECFQSLKPAVEEFIARLHEQEKILAGIEERIRERGDSVAMLEAKRLRYRDIELRLQATINVREDVAQRLAQLQATEVSLRAAETTAERRTERLHFSPAAMGDLRSADARISGSRRRRCVGRLRLRLIRAS